MRANIALIAVRFQIGQIHQHQTIHAVIEIRIAAEIDKLHAARLAHFRVLLIQRRDRAAEVAEQGLQPGQVVVVILPAKLRQHVGQRGRIRATGLRQRVRRREPQPVERHQQIASGGRQPTRNRYRAKQIAIVRVARQISADAGPQVVQPASTPVARLDKAAPQLNAVLQDVVHSPVVVEQTGAVDPLQAALCQLYGRRHKAVSADDLEVFFIPQDQMQIVVIIPVDIPPFAAAFANRAEGDFPQASQLAQQRRLLLTVALPEVNHFAIGGAAQAFGLVQFAFEPRPIFRAGDGAFSFELPRQPFAQLFKVLIAAAGKFASAGLGIEPARPGDLLADTHRQAAVAPAKHLLHQQEQRQVVGDQGAGVKQGAVVGMNPRRQQRGAIFRRQLNKARVPFFIANAATGKARDFPRREENQYPTGL